MSFPLPLRLTLFYALLLGLALCGFGYLVYHQAEQRAYNDLDAQLSNRAASVEMGKDLMSRVASTTPGTHITLPGVNELGTDGVAVEILDTELNLLASTTNPDTGIDTTISGINASPIPWDAQAAHWLLTHPSRGDGKPGGMYSTITYEGQQVRVYTTSNAAFGDVQIIQTARSEQDLQQSLDALRQTLLTGGLLVLILALGGGLYLTRGTLGMVRRVTRTAREISVSQDFSRRVTRKRSLGRDEIAELAETFNSMLANLEKVYRQQRRFIADASHELRAPITSIRCNLDLLARAPDLPEREIDAALADVRAEADRMARLVNDLLTLARSDEIALQKDKAQIVGPASTKEAPSPRLDLDSLLLEVFRQYRGTDAENHSGPRLTLQHITPVQVYGEADRLKQVIVALLDNAFKYTPAGGSIVLSLSVDRQEAILQISDTGIGIAPQDLPHIFERFYRADRARSREQGGSGLGLAIAWSIIQEHHGKVAIESTPGKGSTFSISLPRV